MLTDEELMLKYQNNDFDSFEIIYNRKVKRIYGYLAQKLPTKAIRDEVLQEIFLKFHKSRLSYRPEFLLDQWLFVITKSCVVDQQRQLQKWGKLDEFKERDLVVTSSDSFDEVPASWNLLNEEQKILVAMKVYYGFSYKEIAEKIGKTPQTLRQIFSRAIKLLKSSILEEEKSHEG